MRHNENCCREIGELDIQQVSVIQCHEFCSELNVPMNREKLMKGFQWKRVVLPLSMILFLMSCATLHSKKNPIISQKEKVLNSAVDWVVTHPASFEEGGFLEMGEEANLYYILYTKAHSRKRRNFIGIDSPALLRNYNLKRISIFKYPEISAPIWSLPRLQIGWVLIQGIFICLSGIIFFTIK